MGCGASRIEHAEAKDGEAHVPPSVTQPAEARAPELTVAAAASGGQAPSKSADGVGAPVAKPQLHMRVAAAGCGATSWAKVMTANHVAVGGAAAAEESAQVSAAVGTGVTEAEAELCAAAAEAAAAHLSEVGEEDNAMVMSWDGGCSFHYGDPTHPIPASSLRHAAEARCYRAVLAKDAAAAPTEGEKEAQQLGRGVYVWWLVLFAQVCEESWTTADVVRLKVRPMTRHRRCRFTELSQMRDKTGAAAVFISHTWGARFRELAAAIAYALPPDTLVWIDVLAVRQWPGNVGDIDFRPVVHKTNALLLVARHLEQVADIQPSAIINANCQLDMRGGEGEAKTLQFVMRTTLREIPSDQLATCAFFRIWCVVELVAALMADIPVLMLVGAEKRIGHDGHGAGGAGGEGAAGFLVQGAGSQEANGTYLRDGQYGGAPLYKKGQWWLLRYSLGSGARFWYIADKDRLNVDAGDLYRVRCDADQPPLGGWDKACDGFFPPPTLSRLVEEVELEGESEAGMRLKKKGEEVAEGLPLGPFEPNAAMLKTLLECVDVGKAIASVESDRSRELASVRAGVGIGRANCKARGAIIGAQHAMRVVPVLHAAATGQLEHLGRLRDADEREAALVAAAAVGLTGGVQSLLSLGTDGELNGAADPFHTRVLDTALEAAACGGHVATLRLFLAQQPPPLPTAVQSAFLKACAAGQRDTAGVLLDAGASIEARDAREWTGLILGALCGSNELCELLLDRGAQIDAADPNLWTAVVWAADRQQVSTVEFLLERGALRHGAMRWARDPEIIRMLTERGGYKGDQDKLRMRDGVAYLQADDESA